MRGTAETVHSANPLYIAVDDRFHNILIDALPETITVNGRDYAINTDFRAGMLFEMLSNDSEMSDEDIAIQTLDIFMPNGFPSDLDAAYQEILWFYRCGYEPPKRRSRNGVHVDTSMEQQIFDYDIDAPLIYAAFKSQYNVDLQDIDHLHWWKFTAMFQGLHETERICEIMGYRSMDLGKVKDKELRQHYASLKSKYALPNSLSVAEKVSRAGSIFAGGIGNG